MCRYCVGALVVLLAGIWACWHVFKQLLKTFSSLQMEELNFVYQLIPKDGSDIRRAFEKVDGVMQLVPMPFGSDDLTFWSIAICIVLSGLMCTAVPLLIKHFFRHLVDFQDRPLPRVLDLPAELVFSTIQSLLYTREYDIFQDSAPWTVTGTKTDDAHVLKLSAMYIFTAEYTRYFELVRHKHLKEMKLLLDVSIKRLDSKRCELELQFKTPATPLFDNGRSVVCATSRDIFIELKHQQGK